MLPTLDEKHQSQIPALQLLMNLGYQYLSPADIKNEQRGGKHSVLLESTLRKQLHKLNHIHDQDGEHRFSEANISEAIQKLKNVRNEGSFQVNSDIYDLLTLGTSLEQSINGNSKSHDLRYIDWDTPKNNVFHAVPELPVEQAHSNNSLRPDIVLFVNGIPFTVIECKSPSIDIKEAVLQIQSYQQPKNIPHLFHSVQLLIGVNKNHARYATVGSRNNMWSSWKELPDNEADVSRCINQPLPQAQTDKLFSTNYFTDAKEDFEAQAKAKEPRLVTEQDKTIYNLCRPARLLELAHRFIVFENLEKKIARYHQYFVIQSILKRIHKYDKKGCRKGGLVWHTQGSGKSLTMIMLARNLIRHESILNPRIVLVTDRTDLDDQLSTKFRDSELVLKTATTGKDLLKLISENRTNIITTLIHKFDKALNSKEFQEKSKDIFMLVDESHRTQYKNLAARMRQMLPNACYIGFTGTPLQENERNSFRKFGGLIDPTYPIRQAVDDKAVVPLLYQGRLAEIEQKDSIDLWFERITKECDPTEKARLKRKYSLPNQLNQADQVVRMRAYDINEHYRNNWQHKRLKAQLVAPNKVTAIKYHECLKELGDISSAVVISPPHTHESNTASDKVFEQGKVVDFWDDMVSRYGSVEKYDKQIIKQFKQPDGDPEILIVVNKLLTGFDAPINTVLYLCCTMSTPHNLLQAIARVNRLYEGKEYGHIVDYYNSLKKLDQALNKYDTFIGFKESEIEGTLDSIQKQIKQLPQYHSSLLGLFKKAKGSMQDEVYERLLKEDEQRKTFYEYLGKYRKTLDIALSSEQFIGSVSSEKFNEYREHLKFFNKLQKIVRLRYFDSPDSFSGEPKVQELLNQYLHSDRVTPLHEPKNLLNADEIREILKTYEMSQGAQADAMAHMLKKSITDRMDENQDLHKKFSEHIQKAIDDYHQGRIDDALYEETVDKTEEDYENAKKQSIPEIIRDDKEATNYYQKCVKPVFDQLDGVSDHILTEAAANTALEIAHIFQRQRATMYFWDNPNAKRAVANDIDDYLCNEVIQGKHEIALTSEQVEQIIESAIDIAPKENTQ